MYSDESLARDLHLYLSELLEDPRLSYRDKTLASYLCNLQLEEGRGEVSGLYFGDGGSFIMSEHEFFMSAQELKSIGFIKLKVSVEGPIKKYWFVITDSYYLEKRLKEY